MKRNVVFVLALSISVTGAGMYGAQVPARQGAPTIKTEQFQPLVSIEGKDNFLAYCAVCHGVSGKGDGPAVPALKAALPDLTTMRTRAGKFDGVAVERFIAGADKVPPAHGSADMPMWGPIFKSQSPEQVGAIRIKNLVRYLESIQRPRS